MKKVAEKKTWRAMLHHAYKQLAILWAVYIALLALCCYFAKDMFLIFVISLVFQLTVSVFVLRIASDRKSLEEREKQKSSFLANMSHEIRTPLNAIIGFAELALREDIPPAAYEHVFTIKQAGSNLLSIINGILDFSKIESGKLEITESEYQFASLLADVVSVIKVRATYSRLRFVVNIDSKIPATLIGDEVKVRQVLLNILSNAVKYTERGFVTLAIKGEIPEATDNMVILRVRVADSGKGIKEEDIKKLFRDYVRVDKTKNKDIEGTGLGLVITNNIVNAMGGSIFVESEYGAGSVFKIMIPQKFKNAEPHAQIKDAEKLGVLIFERREIYFDSIIRTLENLGVRCKNVSDELSLDSEAKSGAYDFILTAPVYCERAKEAMAKSGKRMRIVLLTEFGDTIPDLSLSLLSMPAYSIIVADVLNGAAGGLLSGAKKDDFAKFTAPDAKVLVVDDTNTNLRVAEGLLSPYKMKVTTCRSGLEAISAVRSDQYDIVFMDHMMPGMDGVETTKQIRRLGGEYFTNLPIVALTANAISGAREMFLKEGFNDFIAKPIDIKKLNGILDRWISADKRRAPTDDDGGSCGEETIHKEAIKLLASTRKVDVEKGLKISGGKSAHYLRTVTIFYEDGFLKIEEIKRTLEQGDMQLYATHVHGLKSAAASIGAEKISEDARVLEAAAKEKNKDYIIEHTPKFLLDLENLLRDLGFALGTLKSNEKGKHAGILVDELVKLKNALENLDSEAIDKATVVLQGFENTDEFGSAVKEILQNVLVGEYDEVFEGIDNLLAKHKRGEENRG